MTGGFSPVYISRVARYGGNSVKNPIVVEWTENVERSWWSKVNVLGSQTRYVG